MKKTFHGPQKILSSPACYRHLTNLKQQMSFNKMKKKDKHLTNLRQQEDLTTTKTTPQPREDLDFSSLLQASDQLKTIILDIKGCVEEKK